MYDRFKWKTRWSVRPNRYYVIDFGMSKKFDQREGVQVLGVLGQDRSVPEMSNTVPYDPFPMDVYQLGSMLLRIYKVPFPLLSSCRCLDLIIGLLSNRDPRHLNIFGTADDEFRPLFASDSERSRIGVRSFIGEDRILCNAAKDLAIPISVFFHKENHDSYRTICLSLLVSIRL